MKIILTTIILATNFYSCHGLSRSNKNETIREDSLAKDVIARFYEWYIFDAYENKYDYYQIPSYSKINETTYVFNEEEYEKRLREVKFLSEKFIENSVIRLNACNGKMRKIEWESEPEPQFNIQECNYLWGDTWIGGQGENINGFTIKSLEVQPDGRVQGIVDILIDKKKFVQSEVMLSKQDEAYKIDAIELVWD